MLDKKIADGLNVGAWTSGEDVWDWWTTGKEKDPDCEGQVYMFDD